MSFEKFVKCHRYYCPIPKLSIWTRGQIGLNRSALKECNIKKDKNVWFAICFYDAKEKKIGLQFTQEKQEGVTRVCFTKIGGAILSVKKFFDYYEIGYKKCQRYDIEFDEKEKMYVVKLEEYNES